jgi:putative glycosyltransferase (TIGR04372 family)
MYMCERDAGTHGSRRLDIFYHSGPISNQQLKSMWERVLPVWPIARPLDRLNQRLPGATKHVVPLRTIRDIDGLLRNSGPHLSFTQEEIRLGQTALTEMGIVDSKQFVCFHVRDSAYLNNAFPTQDWSYHDYRNSSINNYIPAAIELVARGHFAIRMGASVTGKLDTDVPQIIDYASNGKRNDFLDIYLSALCRFFISTGSGIDAVSMSFRRPVLYVNFLPLEYLHTWGPDDLMIPKYLWLPSEDRFLSFRETIESGAGRLLHSEFYRERGIEVIENTPQEIKAAAVEMDERLNGTWERNAEDDELQQRFWSIYSGSDLHGEIVARISAQFLRENRHLLD